MTVSSTNTKRQFNGDGSTAAFAYNFKVFADADLQVIVRSATGTESVKTSGSHYNASGIGETSGGTVTFTSGNIPASGETITLRRAKTIAQELSLVANDPFPAANLNDQLDKMTHLILQNNEELDRALKLSRTNTMTSTEFTQSATDRASKVLSFDSSGEIAVTQELGTFRGNWAASTAYNERDIIRDNSSTGNQSIYIVITAHSSSGSLPITTNTDAAKFSAIIDNTTATTTTNVTSITNDALVVGRDADNQLKFSTDNQIIFRVGAGDGVTFKASGEIEATSLDISGDADIDGTLEADAITIGGTTLAETIADTVGAMVSSNTESGIAVTYDDSDNTLDFTVASITAVGALNSGSITSGFGAIDNGSSAITTTGTITAGTFVLGTASLNENDLESIDGITAGTAAASKALILDANLDNSGARNITISGELDAATLDISGNADIDGTLEADAITLGGTALGSLYSPIAGSSSIVTTGALNSGSITSGFGTIDTGSSTITTTGEVGVGRLNLSSAVSSGDLGSDKAQVGYHSADGLLLMGQGTTNDVSLINDTGTVVGRIPTGSTIFAVTGQLQSTGATGGKVFLTTSEATVVANDSLGAVEFYATSETAPDGNSKAGAIECTAEGTFAGDNNATQMLFKLGVSEAASTKMTLSSGGNLTVTGDYISSTAGTSNLRLGVNAGNSIASGGNYNVVLGDEAGTALTTGDDNVAIGFEALSTEDAHGDNVAIGYQALKTLNAGAEGENVAIGHGAGTAMTTGVQSVLVGKRSGDALTNADRNTAVGYATLSADTLGSKSTAVGYAALFAQNFTTATDTYNTAVGYEAGGAVTTGVGNTLVGGLAGDALTDADFNVAIGKNALSSDTLGSFNTAVGINALETQNFTTATNAYNTAIGALAGGAVTTGIQNTLIGGLAGDAITTGISNVAVGSYALSTNVAGDQCTAVGHGALFTQNPSGNSDMNNTAVGYNAGQQVTTGDRNTLIGSLVGDAITTGSANTALGFEALSANTTANSNTAIGAYSLDANTTGGDNVAVGSQALGSNTEGAGNVVVGLEALTTDTLGSKSTAVGTGALANQNFTTATDSANTAVGFSAGGNVTTGINNSLVGFEAGDKLTDADHNVAIGRRALYSNTLGSKSIAIGTNALHNSNHTTATDALNVAIGFQAGNFHTTGAQNTLVGANAGLVMTTGLRNTLIGENSGLALATSNSDNVFVGQGSGSAITSGDANVIIGRYSGNAGSLDIRTSSNNIVLSDGDGTARMYVNSSGQALIGDFTWRDSGTKTGLQVAGAGGGPYVIVCKNDDTSGGANQIKFLDGSNDICGTIASNATNNTTAYGTSSDYRLKENVTDVSNAISTFKTLKPKTYNFISDPDDTPENGFLAHELATVVPNAVIGEKDAVTSDGAIEPQQVDYGKLTPILTAALQEAIAKIETLESENTAIKNRLDALEAE